MTSIKVIAGLGNPGSRYENTRHNIGFQVLDYFASKHTSILKWREKYQSLVTEVQVAGAAVYLIKPQTYMNRSGGPIRELMQFYHLNVSELVVVHDDLDLDTGCLRLKIGGGDGGHNGLRSITEGLSSPDYIRVRVGIGHPRRLLSSCGDPQNIVFDGEVHDWVLGRFFPQEIALIEQAIDQSSQALEELIRRDLKSAQQKFNSTNNSRIVNK